MLQFQKQEQKKTLSIPGINRFQMSLFDIFD